MRSGTVSFRQKLPHQQKVRSWRGLGTTERLGGAYAELCRLEPSGPLRVSGALWRSLEISEPRRCNERKRLTRIGICRNVGKTEPRHERMTPCKWCRSDPRRSNSASHMRCVLSVSLPVETCTRSSGHAGLHCACLSARSLSSTSFLWLIFGTILDGPATTGGRATHEHSDMDDLDDHIDVNADYKVTLKSTYCLAEHRVLSVILTTQQTRT